MSCEGQALRIERVSTGVAGLDEVLGGGIPMLTGLPVAAGEPTP